MQCKLSGFWFVLAISCCFSSVSPFWVCFLLSNIHKMLEFFGGTTKTREVSHCCCVTSHVLSTQFALKYFRHQHDIGVVGRRERKKAQANCIWSHRANGKRGSEASVKERASCHSCSENAGETELSVSWSWLSKIYLQYKTLGRRSDWDLRLSSHRILEIDLLTFIRRTNRLGLLSLAF